MLRKIKLAQFGGVNTITDSANIGVSMVRECKNFILRPLGGLSVPPAWSSFTCGGAALDLGYINTADYLFDGGRLLLEDELGAWWNVTPDITGDPINQVVTYAGSELSANLVLTSSQVMAFKLAASTYIRLTADQTAMGWATVNLGYVPYYTTRYTADRAFANGFGPVFTDSVGNKWKLYAKSDSGLDAITIA